MEVGLTLAKSFVALHQLRTRLALANMHCYSEKGYAFNTTYLHANDYRIELARNVLEAAKEQQSPKTEKS